MATLPCRPPAGRFELTRLRWVRALLRRRAVNWLLMTVGLTGLGLALVAGFAGTAVGSANFGIVFVWIVWWALLIVVLVPAGGRAWCLVCPIPAPGEWLQRRALVEPAGCAAREERSRFAHRRRWPRRLRGIWLQNAGFLATALLSAVILTRPLVTAWVLLAFLVAGLALSLVFERRAFCRYLCPVGGFIGLYALVAPLELRTRDPLVCRDHRMKDCYLGNESGYGCPWLEQPWTLARNAYCGLCGECFRTCPKDNVAVYLRPPGSDLLVAAGWRLDEAYKAFIMLACAAAYSLVLLGPWGWVKDWANLGSLTGFGLYAMAFLGLATVAVPGAHLALAAATRRAAGLPGVPVPRLFVALAYPLVPLGLAAWIAFTFSFVFANLSYALPVLSDPFGWGWDLLGTGAFVWRPWLDRWVPLLQVAVLVTGLVAAIATADGVLRKFIGGRGAILGLSVQATALTAETLFFIWLYLGAPA